MELLKEAGYMIKDACSVLGIIRSGYYAARQPKASKMTNLSIRDVGLLEKIREIKLDHPFWGYRRVRAWLRHREKIQIGRKKSYP